MPYIKLFKTIFGEGVEKIRISSIPNQITLSGDLLHFFGGHSIHVLQKTDAKILYRKTVDTSVEIYQLKDGNPVAIDIKNKALLSFQKHFATQGSRILRTNTEISSTELCLIFEALNPHTFGKLKEDLSFIEFLKREGLYTSYITLLEADKQHAVYLNTDSNFIEKKVCKLGNYELYQVLLEEQFPVEQAVEKLKQIAAASLQIIQKENPINTLCEATFKDMLHITEKIPSRRIGYILSEYTRTESCADGLEENFIDHLATTFRAHTNSVQRDLELIPTSIQHIINQLEKTTGYAALKCDISSSTLSILVMVYKKQQANFLQETSSIKGIQAMNPIILTDRKS